jgi:hypothetical protein
VARDLSYRLGVGFGQTAGAVVSALGDARDRAAVAGVYLRGQRRRKPERAWQMEDRTALHMLNGE